MAEKITVPTLGESVTEATVSKWLKSKGEKVSADEPLVELETDKVNVEVPSPISGVLSNISVKEGETVNVGSLLGTIENSSAEKNNLEEVKKKIIDKKTYSFEKNHLPIEVESAFGGFGIYKLNKILKFKYNSFSGQQCEHVKFNEDIYNKYGGLFIDKNLINSHGINKHTINGYLCSKSNFFAKRFISKIQ